jgi:hypothetical protein
VLINLTAHAAVTNDAVTNAPLMTAVLSPSATLEVP